MPEPGVSGSPPQGTIFKVGELLNNTYRIEAILGRGGTSEVYCARSEISGRRVAVKVLRSEFSDNEAFQNLMAREENVREIRHDAVLPYFHNERTDAGRVYLIMDYVEGPSLEQKMREGGMSADALMTLAERVAGGLQAAHARKIVHRDLSPDNIILRNGDPADAVIIDFGIAKDTNPGAETVVGKDFAGKYAYAAPEQLNGQTDPRSDVYSLGAVLLAAFRGRSLAHGLTPMEILRNKGQPLDTQAVPEPLRSLIDRMTRPDRDERLQSASEVLAAIRESHAPDRTAGPDETVIRPRASSGPPAGPAAGEPSGSKGGGRPPGPGGRGQRLLLGLAAVLTLVAVGVVAFFAGFLDGLLPARYPFADPYTLVVERVEEEAPQASGHVPSAEVQAALAEAIDAEGGTTDLRIARGDISEDWGQGILALVDGVSELEEWRISAQGNAVDVAGSTGDAALRDRLALALPQRARPAGLELEMAIEVEETVLPASDLEPILAAHADCGPLRLVDPPPIGYAPGDRVTVGGWLAEPGTEVALAEALSTVAGEREVSLQTRLLNPALCTIDAALPQVPDGGFEIGFAEGRSDAPRPDGEFVVGENPVIDVTIPAGVTEGYLNVILVDVSGNVFHLLPNRHVQDNSIAALRDGREGPVTVRVAHTLEEREVAGGSLLAFTVDDTALGESQILAIYSEEPILDGQRPVEESAASFAEALAELEAPIETLDRQTITTTER